MTGLTFLACQRCDRVHAEVLAPTRCRHCRADALVDITGELQGDRYFDRPRRS